MAGRNQHNIPRFLQRAFGVKRSRKPNEIWTFKKDQPPAKHLIKKTAVDVDFYSSPSADGTPTLDDKITDAETPLANLVRSVRDRAEGSSVSGEDAAEIITQLAPRTSHIRHTMIEGFRQLTASARDLFSDPEVVEQLMGLDKDELNDRFLDRFRDAIKDRPEFQTIPLPAHVVERMAFCLAKENFDSTIASSLGSIGGLIQHMGKGSHKIVRDSHNRALAGDNEVNVRRDLLKTFSWTIEPAPAEGAVLPDCIALASEDGEDWLPVMFVGKQMDAAVMPLASGKLLVGKKEPSALVNLAGINEDLAAGSHDFFLAATDDAAFAKLSDGIGERSKRYFVNATRDAIASFLLPAAEPPESGGGDDRPLPEPPPDIRYELSFLSVADAETTQRISDVTASVVGAFVRTHSMSRLEGITFAADYPTALRAVDRGIEGAAPVETVGPEIGVGIARRVVIVRDGRAMARIVINGFVGHYLISDDPAEADWALNVMSSQLALVALMDLVETALPGASLKPPGTPFDLFLYVEADAAIHAYVAAYVAGGFGNADDISATYRELLINALDRLKGETEQERLAYRTHADLDKLLSVAMPAAGFVLHFAAQLLGHASANGRTALDEAGEVEDALERLGLVNWLSDFYRHLERFQKRLGRWTSFDEFLSFNRHVERLLWSVGLIPWDTPEGPWIEVPIFTDAMALMEQMAKGEISPSE